MAAQNQQLTPATADALPAAWPGVDARQAVRSPQMDTVKPGHTGLPWLPIGAGAAAVLLALLLTTVVYGRRTQARAV